VFVVSFVLCPSEESSFALIEAVLDATASRAFEDGVSLEDYRPENIFLVSEPL
jgi:hypothetical protein